MNITSGLPTDFNPHAYDALVVGCGFAGVVCARRLAENCGFRVAILERRNHIAGNAYDCLDDAGILIHTYGPHIYHTTSHRVHSFLSRFTDWLPYQHKVLANIHGTLMPVPFNHESLNRAFGDERGEALYEKLKATFGSDKKVPIMELRERHDADLQAVADYIYENIFLHYTEKQWDKTPDQIDPAVMGRVPVFIGDDDRYFPQATYQGMPKDGYTALFERMLDHDLISVFVDVDARDVLSVENNEVHACGSRYDGEVIYTGPLDELFNLDNGDLPYRTVDMQFETLNQDEFQPVATVNYTVSEKFTRITEFKHMGGPQPHGKTTILREYPMPYTPNSGQTPYYVINEPQNIERYKQYRTRVDSILNFHVVGRLAEYRYYDMDGVCASALELSDEIIAHR